jgi:hypothetical protein
MTTPDLARTEIQALVKQFKALSATARKGMNEGFLHPDRLMPPAPAAERGAGQGDRPEGVWAVWADGGGDRDR